ncbi:MAG: hypothetical protein ABIA78_01555 [archaeon]
MEDELRKEYLNYRPDEDSSGAIGRGIADKVYKRFKGDFSKIRWVRGDEVTEIDCPQMSFDLEVVNA